MEWDLSSPPAYFIKAYGGGVFILGKLYKLWSSIAWKMLGLEPNPEPNWIWRNHGIFWIRTFSNAFEHEKIYLGQCWIVDFWAGGKTWRSKKNDTQGSDPHFRKSCLDVKKIQIRKWWLHWLLTFPMFKHWKHAKQHMEYFSKHAKHYMEWDLLAYLIKAYGTEFSDWKMLGKPI